MAQVVIQVNGRNYDIACDDGQEPHVERLGRYVDRKLADLVKQIGQVGDARLLVMAALLITDELSEAYGELEEVRGGNSGIARTDAETVEGLNRLARRVEALAERIEQD